MSYFLSPTTQSAGMNSADLSGVACKRKTRSAPKNEHRIESKWPYLLSVRELNPCRGLLEALIVAWRSVLSNQAQCRDALRLNRTEL